jgi:hypothetical protein
MVTGSTSVGVGPNEYALLLVDMGWRAEEHSAPRADISLPWCVTASHTGTGRTLAAMAASQVEAWETVFRSARTQVAR